MSKVQTFREPGNLPAHLLAGAIARGEMSAGEVLEAQLRRIEARNGALNAVVALDVEGARKRAALADAARARGEALGPLHGVPITLKDAHAVAGLRTTAGVPALDGVSRQDGTVAARLRAAGANVIGRSNVAAGLADPLQSDNPIFGPTRNPWDPTRIPGGSSGGAAAAVATSLTPLEVGSDLAGSIRLPAHFCGVYGLKPTEHRVPLTGFFPSPPEVPRAVRIMNSLGPLARDLADLELCLRIVAGPDGRDSDVPPVPLGPTQRCALPGLRLAMASGFPGSFVARPLRQRVEQLAARASDAGARVEARLPEIPWAEVGELFGELAGTITSLFVPGAEQRSLAWYFRALERRDQITSLWVRFFEGEGEGEGDGEEDGVDVLVLPPAMTTAFPIGKSGAPVEVEGRQVSYWEVGSLPVMFNLTGLPALVVPAGVDEAGLPLGVQLVGPPWSEQRLLAVAAALEEADILPGWSPPRRLSPSA